MRKYIKRMSRLVTRILTVLFFVCILTFFYTPFHDVPVGYATAGVDEIDGSGALDSEGPDDFNLSISTNQGSASLSGALKIFLVLTIISLAPSILIMVTSFTRILITLHFTRSALGTQTTPPNQILIGLALFLSIFIMAPVFTQVNSEAIEPYSNGTITQEEAIEKGIEPLRTFMLKQTRRKDLKTFIGIAGIADEELESVDNIPITVIIPSFIISELRKAFIIGFLIYLPFIIIDMVVASTLMSMGMMMLPPTTISMPFKILLFILADGWNLIIGEVVRSFY
ncbi:MAG: flagellar type III secretion system pore protein FliP [Clostridiales bacterium]|nr:flagellar type III secretion system pore protein FliP [Clostridiales bacterium]